MKPRSKRRKQHVQQDKQKETPFFGNEQSFFNPGTGKALSPAEQQFFAPRLGVDLSQVQVHTGKEAAASADALQAKAYTHGNHVVFNDGFYNPGTREGNRLMAHELTHVAQQAGGQTSNIQREPLGGEEGESGKALWDSYENSIEIDAFEFGQPVLTPEHIIRLAEYKKQISAMLINYPDSFLTLWGHTDAVDTEAKNEALGLARAEAVKAELTSGDGALPEAMISTRSMGEREPAVKSDQKQPKNRRVQLMFTARRTFTPRLNWTSPPPLNFDYKTPQIIPPYQYTPEGETDPSFNYKPVPDLNIPRKTPIQEVLEHDPILKKLPKDWREKVIDAAKDADESLVDKALDFIPTDENTKKAVKAAFKAAIQTAKGKRWTPPIPSPYEIPPSGAPKYEPAPGEQIFKLPPLKFDENNIIKWFKKL